MTLYLSNRDGNGKTNEEGHYKFQTGVFSGNVIGSGLLVTQNSPLGMSVLVAAGTYKIDTNSDYSYTGWNSSSASVTITTADPANPRITSIVLYVDKGATTSASPPNNPGITKLIAVNGTAASVPSAPNGTTIQSAVGAGNPYIVLANVAVGAAVTQVTNANITDQRVLVSLAADLIATSSILDSAVSTNKLANLAVTTGKVADLAVTTPKLADGAATDAKWRNGIVFNASRAAARSLAAQTFTLFACDSIDTNIGGAYNNASNAGRFTAPVNGVYMFYATLNLNPATNIRGIIELRKNGSATGSRVSDVSLTNWRGLTGMTYYVLNAGDYVEAWAWANVATNIANSTQYTTSFGGCLITRT